MSIQLVILNYNGRALLADCLPSVVRAAAQSRHACRVSIIDNSSTDDSCQWLNQHYPELTVRVCSNRGLVSYNDVLRELTEPVVVLLNNDIRLADDAIDPLVEPLLHPAQDQPCFATAPRAWLFDGTTYEGFRTGLQWRWGLLQATARFPDAERWADVPGETAMAGAVIAVDRHKFVELGGFDPLFSPGRVEDLDLFYRAFQAGYVSHYIPESRAWHRGEATFKSELGSAASHGLALRNTLLFQWKHLRLPRHVLAQAIAIPLRLVFDLVRAPGQLRADRFALLRAWFAALPRLKQALSSSYRGGRSSQREAEFFARYHIPRLKSSLQHVDPAADEKLRWQARHPLSRWYVQPVVNILLEYLTPSGLRPVHVTIAGGLFAIAAIASLFTLSHGLIVASVCVWLAWLCDRFDGPLARHQHTASDFGARCDAAIDELLDVLLHAATALVACRQTHSLFPLFALAAFLFGKGMLLHGIAQQAEHESSAKTEPLGGTRWLYHLPGNTDIRTHLLLAALLSGWLTTELLFIAAYYNLRWIVRLARRLLPQARRIVAEGAS